MPLELVALVLMGLKKVSSPLFLILFVQNLPLFLTILSFSLQFLLCFIDIFSQSLFLYCISIPDRGQRDG